MRINIHNAYVVIIGEMQNKITKINVIIGEMQNKITKINKHFSFTKGTIWYE
jgi:hypothetical protein